ncbi:GPI-anchored surface protein, putative, partial [Bodo saltans]
MLQLLVAVFFLSCVPMALSFPSFTPWSPRGDISLNAGAQLTFPEVWQLPIRLPKVTGALDISALPPVSSGSFSNFNFGDVHWSTTNIEGIQLVMRALNSASFEAGVTGIAVTTQATAFSLSQAVLGTTVTCSGTLVVTVPQTGVFVTLSNGNVRAAVRLDGISTALSFSSTLCSIAASISPQLVTAVQNAVSNAISSDSAQRAIGDKLTELFQNATNAGGAIDASIVNDTLNLLNNTLPSNIIEDIHQVFSDPASAASAAQNFIGPIAKNIIAMFAPSGADIDAITDALVTLAMENLNSVGGAEDVVGSWLSNLEGTDPTEMIESLISLLPEDVQAQFSQYTSVDGIVNLAVALNINVALADQVQGIVDFLQDELPGGTTSVNFASTRWYLDALRGSSPSADTVTSLFTSFKDDIGNWANAVNISTLPQDVQNFITFWKDLTSISHLVNELPYTLSNLTNLIAHLRDDVKDTTFVKTVNCIVDALQHGMYRLNVKSISSTSAVLDVAANSTLTAALDTANSAISVHLPNPPLSSDSVVDISIAAAVVQGYSITPSFASGSLPLNAIFSWTSLSVTIGTDSASVSTAIAIRFPFATYRVIQYLEQIVSNNIDNCVVGAILNNTNNNHTTNNTGGGGVCVFKCPDSTCAANLAACSCVLNAGLYNVSAAFVREVTAFDVTNDLTATGFGVYRVLVGNCSGYDFTPNLRYTWALMNDSSSNASIFSASGSALFIPRLTLQPDATYTLTLTARGLLGNTVSVSWTVTTV